jgi:hypothetical protein
MRLKHGMSTGAKIGLGIGIFVAVAGHARRSRRAVCVGCWSKVAFCKDGRCGKRPGIPDPGE